MEGVSRRNVGVPPLTNLIESVVPQHNLLHVVAGEIGLKRMQLVELQITTFSLVHTQIHQIKPYLGPLVHGRSHSTEVGGCQYGCLQLLLRYGGQLTRLAIEGRTMRLAIARGFRGGPANVGQVQ